jgi:hypothetical protein
MTARPGAPAAADAAVGSGPSGPPDPHHHGHLGQGGAGKTSLVANLGLELTRHGAAVMRPTGADDPDLFLRAGNTSRGRLALTLIGTEGSYHERTRIPLAVRDCW